MSWMGWKNGRMLRQTRHLTLGRKRNRELCVSPSILERYLLRDGLLSSFRKQRAKGFR